VNGKVFHEKYVKEGQSTGTPSIPWKVVILPLSVCIELKRLQTGTDWLLIITNTREELYKGINIDDLERPCMNPQNSGF